MEYQGLHWHKKKPLSIYEGGMIGKMIAAGIKGVACINPPVFRDYEIRGRNYHQAPEPFYGGNHCP
jgi:hypothetical protein